MANLEYFCTDCGISVFLPLWRYNRRKQPFRCYSCARRDRETYKNNKISDPEKWERIQQAKRDAQHRRHANTTKEARVKHAQKMRSSVKLSGSELRARQQEYIQSAGSEYYKKYCDKRKQIALKFHTSLTSEQKEEHYRKVFKNNGRSKACESCLNILEKENILIEREKYVNGYFVDGLIIGTNVVVEFYGDMFHCNPTKFHDPNQYCSWIKRTVQEQWDRDRQRISALLRYGYKVIIIWEQDWMMNKNKQIERVKYEMC